MLLREELIVEKLVFKPIIENVAWPKLVILIKQIGKNIIMLLDKSDLKQKHFIFNKIILLVHLVTFVLSVRLRPGLAYVDLKLLGQHLYYLKVATINSEVQRIPHGRVFDLALVAHVDLASIVLEGLH